MTKRKASGSRRVRSRKAKRKASAKASARAAKQGDYLRVSGSQRAANSRSSAEQNRAFAPQFPGIAIKAVLKSDAEMGDMLVRRASSSDVAAWLSCAGTARALMNLAHDAILIRNPDSVVESWNTGAQELYGWTPAETIGRVSHDLLETKFPVSAEAAYKALLETGFWEGELTHRRKDGKHITVLSRQSLLRTAAGRPLLIKEINRDITQERRHLAYLRLLSEVGETVALAPTTSEALRSFLASICVHTHWRCGHAVAIAPQGSIQQPDASVWYIDDEQRFGPVRNALERKRLQIGEATIAARALKSGSPVWISDLSADPYFKRMPELAEAGLVCAFAQPVAVADGTNAVVVVFSDMPADVDESFLHTMGSVAALLRRFFEHQAAKEAQRRISVSLMKAQDDERRRIARELHDSTGQYLGALGLAIEVARRSTPETLTVAREKFDEADRIIKRCSEEIRTLSHLLHPPLLEDFGLASTVNWYLDAFTKRTRIQVTKEIPRLGRFDHSTELALFRVLQECLNNIHRHSGSKTAFVKIDADAQQVMLEVRDQGKGIPREMLDGWLSGARHSGIGISGMRERLNDLGGALEIDSTSEGTAIRATIPLRAEAGVGQSGASAGANSSLEGDSEAKAPAKPKKGNGASTPVKVPARVSNVEATSSAAPETPRSKSATAK